MLTRYLLVALVLSLPAATSAWEESFPAVAGTWNEQQVLDFILARSPILKGYQVVTKEYTPSKPMQRVLEHTSVFARVSPSDLGGTQTTASSDNFLVSAGTTVGVQLSIPLASRKEEREHALKALDEIKAVEQLRTTVLQDLGVLRQHEADYQATQLRIALWKDKSGWAQQRVSTGYDDVTGLWDVAQKLNEEKSNLGKLSLAITSQQHKVAACMPAKRGRSFWTCSVRTKTQKRATQWLSYPRLNYLSSPPRFSLPQPPPSRTTTMRHITELIGRDALLDEAAREIKKGKHVLLTGPVGIGKSAVLIEAIRRIERRKSERVSLEITQDGPLPEQELLHAERLLTFVYLRDHQAKGQFVTLARRLLQTGILKPSSIELPKRLVQVHATFFAIACLRCSTYLHVK